MLTGIHSVAISADSRGIQPARICYAVHFPTFEILHLETQYLLIRSVGNEQI